MADLIPPKHSLGNVLVIGGCGFLGHHIVRQLDESYSCTLSVLDLRTTNNRIPNASYYDADITSADDVRSVFESVKPQIIIHTASPAPASVGSAKGPTKSLYHKVNVEGTRTLIEEAAKLGSVKAFIYTSSASVIHDTRSDLINADERWPLLYSPIQKEYYSETKAVAEKLVLDANRKHADMLTCALRPAGIFGEGDMQYTPNLLQAYEKGQTKFQLGANENLFDFTYVGNVAYAHILAAIGLMQTHALGVQPLDHEKIDGEAFFITNGEPVYFWDFVHRIWREAGDKTEANQIWEIERELGLFIATIIEWLFWFAGGRVPNLTRQKINYTSLKRYYNIDKAKQRLEYEPQVSLEEGIVRSVRWFKDQKQAEAQKKGQ